MIIAAAIIGIGIGLTYGWVINPVVYTDVTPDALRADYRADYVLMVAEAYQSDQNPETAARRIAMIATGFTVGLITLGGYVRITGAGMGCSDHWPLCNGRILPNLADTLEVLEWSHRWVAVMVSGAIAVGCSLISCKPSARQPAARWRPCIRPGCRPADSPCAAGGPASRRA